MKPEAKETLQTLKAMGIQKTVMLTGDRAQAAETVRAQLGVDEALQQSCCLRIKSPP